MSNELVSRKNFVLLTLGLAGGALLSTACGEEDPSPAGGSGGSGGGSGGGSTGGSSGSVGAGGGSSGSSASGGTGQSGGSGGSTQGGSSGSGGSSGDAGGSGGATGGSGGTGGTGGESGGTGGTGGGGGTCAALLIQISCNHDHELQIPLEDVMAGVEKQYTLSHNGTHDHKMTVTAAQFATLKSGGAVHIYVESAVQPHCVTLSCGLLSQPTPAECANDSLMCS